jgi:GNAT superfamily N-acetyltransferase
MVTETGRTSLLDIARDLLESDRQYFEWGARIEDLGGASLTWMAGIEGLPAGCAVQILEPRRITAGDADRWLAGVERRLHEIGCPHPRFYQQVPDAGLERALAARGYRRRTELGLVNLAPPPPTSCGVVLRPVRSDADWAAKVAMHADCPVGPDGYPAPAAAWVELERRKARDGQLEPLLIMVGEHVCGAIAFIARTDILRIKNVVIHPRYRRQRVATRAVERICTLAAAMGKRGAGIFAVPESPGHLVYRGCGFRVLTEQVEWLKVTPVAAVVTTTAIAGEPS